MQRPLSLAGNSMNTFDINDVDREMVVYRKMYEVFSPDYTRWRTEGTAYRKMQYASFYYYVGLAGKETSPYISIGAQELLRVTGKRPVDDHCMTPRLIYQSLHDQCPEVLLDEEKFYHVVDLARITVQITNEENKQVKYKQNRRGVYPIIHARTMDKYDSMGWINKSKGSVILTERKGGKMVNSGFPLKHLIPDWLTAFEEKCMKEHGYL